jgi:hypothetical protein
MGPQPFIRAVLLVAGAFVLGMSALPSGGSALNSKQPTMELEIQQPPRTESIDCGGYDADGNVVNPDAAKITEVPVGADGRARIPDICGGYSQDGTYIGDA